MSVYLKQKPDVATLDSLADFICGDDKDKYPEYRSSSFLTRFFENINIKASHDGSTRKWWVLDVLKQLPLTNLENVILRLVDIREYKGDRVKLEMASRAMNDIMFMENMRVVFNGKDPALVSIKQSSSPIITVNEKNTSDTEDIFIEKEFKDNDIAILGLDSIIEGILKERINESRQCIAHKAPLSSIFMAGSTLEGLLLGVASKYPKKFNESSASPKDSNGKVKAFQDWTLDNFINVAHETGFLGLDVKKFSHVLRDFRNYIHPFQQASSNFTPDEHTAKICLQVLNSAIADLIKVSK